MTQITFCATAPSYPICCSVQSATEVSSQVLLKRSPTLFLPVLNVLYRMKRKKGVVFNCNVDQGWPDKTSFECRT